MVKNPDIVFTLLKFAPMLAVNVTISYHMLIMLLNGRVRKGILIGSIVVKLILVNIGFFIIGSYIWEDEEWYKIAYPIVSVISASFVFWSWNASFPDEKFPKVIVAGMISEGITSLLSLPLLANVYSGSMSYTTLVPWYLVIIITISVFFLIRPFFKKLCDRYKAIRNGDGLIFWMLTIAFILLCYMNTGIGLTKFQQYYIYGLLGAVMVIVAITGACIGLVNKERAKLLAEENEFLVEQQQNMEKHYEAMSRQIDEVRKYRHDIANHMHILDVMINDSDTPQQIKEYGEELMQHYTKIKNDIYCNDMVVNTAIFAKRKVCEEKNIETKIEIQYINRGEISEARLMSVIYNIFDNAIEACDRIADPEAKRYIYFKCGQVKNHLIIESKNSMKAGSYQEGMKTSKRDKTAHGLGLSIIKDTVEMYHGTCYINAKDDQYEIMVTMQVN